MKFSCKISKIRLGVMLRSNFHTYSRTSQCRITCCASLLNHIMAFRNGSNCLAKMSCHTLLYSNMYFYFDFYVIRKHNKELRKHLKWIAIAESPSRARTLNIPNKNYFFIRHCYCKTCIVLSSSKTVSETLLLKQRPMRPLSVILLYMFREINW